MRLQVSDFNSNVEENLQHWARVLGTGKIRRAIFNTVYSNKKVSWTIAEIMDKTNLDRKTIATQGKAMVVGGLLEQNPGGAVVYTKVLAAHHNKNRIIRLADVKTAREGLPTKRNVRGRSNTFVSKVTKNYENIGVMNTGTVNGAVNGNSQSNRYNEDTVKLLGAIGRLKADIIEESTLGSEQRENAISAADDLEAEAQKPKGTWNLGKVRNAVSAMQLMTKGSTAVHQLYTQLHPLISAHFHLPG